MSKYDCQKGDKEIKESIKRINEAKIRRLLLQIGEDPHFRISSLYGAKILNMHQKESIFVKLTEAA